MFGLLNYFGIDIMEADKNKCVFVDDKWKIMFRQNMGYECFYTLHKKRKLFGIEWFSGTESMADDIETIKERINNEESFCGEDMKIVARSGMISKEDFKFSGLNEGQLYDVVDVGDTGFYIMLNGKRRWFHRSFFNMSERSFNLYKDGYKNEY